MIFRKTILYNVNSTDFFISHRLEIAKNAIQKGYRVVVVGDKKSEIFDPLGIQSEEIKIKRSTIGLLGNIELIYQYRKIYKKHQPDLIHHITLKPIIFGSIAAKFSRNRAKIINAVSGLGVTFANQNWVSLAIKNLLKFSLNPNHHFIFQNESDRDIFKSLKLLRSNYIMTNGSGVNKKIFSYSPKKSKDKIIITLTARMLLEKGIIVLSKAAKLLEKKYFGKVEFHLFGPIDNQNPSALSEQELLALNIKDYFIWKGNSNDIVKVLSKTDIYCLPTHYGEGIPKSIIEAMAIGRPIITTNIPGCKKCVIEGQNGYLIPIKDPVKLSKKIEKLINDKPLREKMGKNSRTLVEKDFTLDKVVNQTFELYNNVLKL